MKQTQCRSAKPRRVLHCYMPRRYLTPSARHTHVIRPRMHRHRPPDRRVKLSCELDGKGELEPRGYVAQSPDTGPSCTRRASRTGRHVAFMPLYMYTVHLADGSSRVMCRSCAHCSQHAHLGRSHSHMGRHFGPRAPVPHGMRARSAVVSTGIDPSSWDALDRNPSRSRGAVVSTGID